jgi:hypothetical protein
MGKDAEGSSRCLIELLSRRLPGGTGERHVRFLYLRQSRLRILCRNAFSWQQVKSVLDRHLSKFRQCIKRSGKSL